MMKRSGNLRKAQELIITNVTSFNSRQQMETPGYPLLTRIVKAALVLPHRNSDVERGISVNSRMLTAERNKLSEETIKGLRNTKDMVKFSDPQSHRHRKSPYY